MAHWSWNLRGETIDMWGQGDRGVTLHVQLHCRGETLRFGVQNLVVLLVWDAMASPLSGAHSCFHHPGHSLSNPNSARSLSVFWKSGGLRTLGWAPGVPNQGLVSQKGGKWEIPSNLKMLWGLALLSQINTHFASFLFLCVVLRIQSVTSAFRSVNKLNGGEILSCLWRKTLVGHDFFSLTKQTLRQTVSFQKLKCQSEILICTLTLASAPSQVWPALPGNLQWGEAVWVVSSHLSPWCCSSSFPEARSPASFWLLEGWMGGELRERVGPLGLCPL